MAVAKFSNKPTPKSGPNPSRKFVPLPRPDGTVGLGSTPAPPGVTSKGLPSVKQNNPKKNFAKINVKPHEEQPSREKGTQSKLPSDVKTGFNILP